MTFEKKYLKYKAKYINLKQYINSINIQDGGGSNNLCTNCLTSINNKSFYSSNIMDLNNLTATPSMLEMYGYELKGGHHLENLINFKEDHTNHPDNNDLELNYSPNLELDNNLVNEVNNSTLDDDELISDNDDKLISDNSPSEISSELSIKKNSIKKKICL